MTPRYCSSTYSREHWSVKVLWCVCVCVVYHRARRRALTPPSLVQVQAQKKRQQQQELIAELRKRQAKDHRPVYEGKDGTIEDIITGGPGSTLSGPSAGAAGSPSRPRPKMTVVVHCSAPLQCTLCYVVQTPPHLEHST